jgi:hypothetical protein
MSHITQLMLQSCAACILPTGPKICQRPSKKATKSVKNERQNVDQSSPGGVSWPPTGRESTRRDRSGSGRSLKNTSNP